jgi:hypothetical protein
VFFTIFEITDDGQSPKPPVFLDVLHHRQNPLEFTRIITLIKILQPATVRGPSIEIEDDNTRNCKGTIMADVK